MEYTITTKEKVNLKLSSETNIALWFFRRVLKAQKHLDKVSEQLEDMVTRIPKEDMIHYVRITEEMENA